MFQGCLQGWTCCARGSPGDSAPPPRGRASSLGAYHQEVGRRSQTTAGRTGQADAGRQHASAGLLQTC